MTFVGVGQSKIALTFDNEGLIPSAPTSKPRYSTSVLKKSHFFSLPNSFSDRSLLRTSLIWSVGVPPWFCCISICRPGTPTHTDPIPPQNCVHDALEGSWHITQPEWHNQILVAAISTHKGRFVYIRLSHPDLMITRGEVNLCEITCPVKSIQQFLHLWQRVPVLDSNFVQSPVVNAHAPFPILLGDEKDGCAVWA